MLFSIKASNVPVCFAANMTLSLMELLGRFLKYEHRPDLEIKKHWSEPDRYFENTDL